VAWASKWARKRIWTDNSGRFTVEAIYHGSEPEHVMLQKLDKSTVKVLLSRLSDDDRKLARKNSDLTKKD
jgi:hypothetical protein